MFGKRINWNEDLGDISKSTVALGVTIVDLVVWGTYPSGHTMWGPFISLQDQYILIKWSDDAEEERVLAQAGQPISHFYPQSLVQGDRIRVSFRLDPTNPEIYPFTIPGTWQYSTEWNPKIKDWGALSFAADLANLNFTAIHYGDFYVDYDPVTGHIHNVGPAHIPDPRAYTPESGNYNAFRMVDMSFANGSFGPWNFNMWNISTTGSLNRFFAEFGEYGAGGTIIVDEWDTSHIVDMSDIFWWTNNVTIQGLANWDVSNVTNFAGAFYRSTPNADIVNWDTSSAIDMRSMFSVTNFNEDISGWNVGNVKYFNDMFYNNGVFNQPIGNWDMTSALGVQDMFHHAFAFNQNLGNWDLASLSGQTIDLHYTAMSQINNSLTLQGWASRAAINPPNTVILNFNSVYDPAGLAAKATLESYGWTIYWMSY